MAMSVAELDATVRAFYESRGDIVCPVAPFLQRTLGDLS